jgi:glycosyltransferase involved in cell wall biosynthesis
LGRADCLLPDMGITWHATRPPVVLDCWQPQPPADTWSTVLTWNNFRKPIAYRGAVYGSKELEFPKVEQLPGRLPDVSLELAVGGTDPPRQRWQELGWRVRESQGVSDTLDRYREYIQQSRAEFSVAKNVYTATRSGWFSCRSVCYLAAGRPVVVQDTGFSELLPTGEGLLAFSDLEEAVAAIQEVEADYARHQRAAWHVARESFDSSRVLTEILQHVGLV